MKYQFQTLVFLLILIPSLAFSKGGKKKVLTLTNGQYEEFFDTDSIEQIGSVLYNVNTQKIVGFTEFSSESGDSSISPNLISRWLSLDPLASKYPSISPYVFVANNPLRFIDPDGRFLLDVHQRMANKVFQTVQINFKANDNLDASIKNSTFFYGIIGQGTVISGGVTYPDIHMSENKSAHFDQMNYSQIQTNMTAIKKQTSASIEKYKQGGINEEQLGFEVGKNLHSIQDFYSHSNYVELYKATYGNLDNIPTYDEALTNKDYTKFAEVLKTQLKTGNYPAKGPGSHREMNHDVGKGSSYTNLVPETRGKKVTAESSAAEEVAQKASIEYVNEVKKGVE